jgi:hypothetical protein
MKFDDKLSNAKASFSMPNKPLQPALNRPKLKPPQPAKRSMKV